MIFYKAALKEKVV